MVRIGNRVGCTKTTTTRTTSTEGTQLKHSARGSEWKSKTQIKLAQFSLLGELCLPGEDPFGCAGKVPTRVEQKDSCRTAARTLSEHRPKHQQVGKTNPPTRSHSRAIVEDLSRSADLRNQHRTLHRDTDLSQILSRTRNEASSVRLPPAEQCHRTASSCDIPSASDCVSK